MQPLTDRQQETLNFLRDYHSQHDFPPTLREIASHLNIIGTVGAIHHLDALEKKGYLKRQAKGSRGITLLPQASKVTYPEAGEYIGYQGDGLSAVFLPVVGVVRAGMPQPAIEDIVGYQPITETVARTGATFFLRVKGDSMVNAGVLEGDLALIKPQPIAENRDMVVAMIDGEATLKWFHHEGDRVRLQPANPNYEPIYATPDQDVTIIGKVVSIYRSMV